MGFVSFMPMLNGRVIRGQRHPSREMSALSDMVDALCSGETTAEETVMKSLRKISELDENVRAFVSVDAER